MDKPLIYKDLAGFESSSPSVLDRRFYNSQSMLSALSLDQLSTSRASNEAVANSESDSRLSLLASPSTSTSTSLEQFSPSQALLSSINEPDTEGCYLTVPLQGKSSTPQFFPPNMKKIANCGQSYSILDASQISWDISLIKSESPKVAMELSASESTWSPRPPSSQQPDARLCP